MFNRIFKLILISISFFALNGCIQTAALVGPGITVASSGSVAKAGLQLAVDHSIKKETGKNSIVFVKDEVVKSNKKRKFHKEFSNLVEKRVKQTHKKINLKLE